MKTEIQKLRAALTVALDTLSNIADEGIDMDTFNKGGIGFDAVQSINEALNFPQPLWESTGKRAVEFSHPHTDGRYLCVVHMLRELSDDIEFVGKKKGKAAGEALAKQLATELQEGYNDAGIAGHFQVMSVTLHDLDGIG